MDFVEPDERSVLSTVLERDFESNRYSFHSYPTGFLRWICNLIERTEDVTDVSEEELDALWASLRSELLNLVPRRLARGNSETDFPLQQLVALLGLGELLPVNSDTIAQERRKHDWKREFAGEQGLALLALLLEGQKLFALDSIDDPAIRDVVIERIRTLPEKERLNLYNRSRPSIPLHWIPRIEQLPRLPEAKSEYYVLLQSFEPCIIEFLFSQTDGNRECVTTIRNNPVAMDVALLVLADTRPDDINVFRRLAPSPDRLIDLYVRSTHFSGNPMQIVTELIQEGHAKYYARSAPVPATEDETPDDAGGVLTVLLKWLDLTLTEMDADALVSWLVDQKTTPPHPIVLPEEIISIVLDHVWSEPVLGLFRERLRSLFASEGDAATTPIVRREVLQELMLYILEEPSVEDLPILCHGVCSGVFMEELYSEPDYFREIKEAVKEDEVLSEALPTLDVPEWPDPGAHTFWIEVLEKRGIVAPSSVDSENAAQPANLLRENEIEYWLQRFPDDPCIAALHFVEHWPDRDLGSPEADSEIQDFFRGEKHNDATRIRVLGAFIYEDAVAIAPSVISAIPEDANRLAGIARQAINDLRIKLRDDEPLTSTDLDILQPAVLLAGHLDGWWKALKHTVLMMRHLQHAAIGPDLTPRSAVDRSYVGIPLAFQNAVYRVLSAADHDTLRRDMAIGLIEYLKPRRAGQRERAATDDTPTDAGYDPTLKEPDPLWREAYIRALKDLGVKQKAPGKTFHSVLHNIAQSDRSEKVRKAAEDTDRELNGLRSHWASGSSKRRISQAWWWIKQAHLISLNVEINKEEANRTRVTEFR